jgi:hypothetical protein
MAKKFKTIAGYLRNMENQLAHKQAMAELKGQPAISTEVGERDTINHLLPQIGVNTDRIGADEKPRDGVERLQRMAQGDTQVKALAACLKWLKRPRVVDVKPTATFVGATATSWGLTIGGQRFNQEESEALETICRERNVSMTEAIEIFRSGWNSLYEAIDRRK